MVAVDFFLYALLIIFEQSLLTTAQTTDSGEVNTHASTSTGSVARSSARSGARKSARSAARSSQRSSKEEDSEEGDQLKGRRIICLFNHNNYYRIPFRPKMMDPFICTHINYEFATLDDTTYELSPGDHSLDIDEGFYNETVSLKLRNPLLKVMISMGGWMDSTKKYSELVESSSKTDNYIEKAVEFLKTYGFDGLDVAWEFPNCWQGAVGINPNDKQNFVNFLTKVRERFDQEGFLLSISVASVKREINAGYDVPGVSKVVDFINIMSYDMHGPWESFTGHHAQFDSRASDRDQFLNMKGALQIWADLGAERLKLNIGVPTYAKTYTLKEPYEHGMGATATGQGNPGPKSQQPGFLCYSEICQFLNAGNWTEDESREVGFYAYSGDQWACYDPPMMFVRKAKYTIENGFGGLLVKDSSCDDYEGKCFSMAHPLVKMMKMEMVQKVKKLSE